ncbi:MAG: MMPL family transporter [Bacteriovoracales bacterium]|nr:MMPL family transporter [Bacteriovoracales bacterium]
MGLSSLIELMMNRRRTTVLLSFLSLLAFATGLRHLVTVEADIRNHFNTDNPHILELDLLEETYALSDAAPLAVAPKKGTIFTREMLRAVEELTEELWRIPYVTRVDSLTNYSHSQGFQDELIVKPLVEEAGSLSDDDLKRIQRIALSTEEVVGRFVSRDGGVAGLVVSIAFPEDWEAGKKEVMDALYEVMDKARESHRDIDYHLAGEIVLNRAVNDAINDEMEILGPTALGTMLVIATLLLRSLWATLGIVLVLVGVFLSSLGVSGYMGFPLYAESSAALFVLMALTVAHSVHIIEGIWAGLRRGLGRKEAAISSLKSNIWPVFLTSLTTAIGFLSLNFSEMPPFRVMGNIVALGALFAFLYAVTLLPAFLSMTPVRKRPLPSGKLDFLERLGRFVVFQRRTLLWSFGALMMAITAGIFRIELTENVLEHLDESYEFRQSADFIKEKYSGVETYEYSLDSGKPGGITELGYLEKVDAFGKWYKAQPEVNHVFTMAHTLKRLNMNLHSDDPDFYALPANSDLAAQYLLLYELSLPQGRDLNNLINMERSATRATISLKGLSTSEKIELDKRSKTWLRKNAPELSSGAGGMAAVGAYSLQQNIQGMLFGTIIGMAIISFILVLVFRSVRLGLISLIPNFAPAAMAMGLWGHFVGEVGIAASVVTAIAFGIIVDDTIHFMTKYAKSRKNGLGPSESVLASFRSVGKAIIVTTVVFALGFMVFGASGLIPNRVLGLLVGITVVVALLADFLFLPPLLMALDGTKETDEQIRSRLR